MSLIKYNNNNNLIQFNSVHVCLCAKSLARWPTTETTQHTDTNNKGKKQYTYETSTKKADKNTATALINKNVC
jgi:hypothetical protein